MLSKSFTAPIFLLVLTSSVNAQAVVAPALGVKGTPVLGDVQRPSADHPCGNVNIAQTLDTSTPVAADANGTFLASIDSFDVGPDGSRFVQVMQVDASGAGENFVPAGMVVNGNPAPRNDATQQLFVQLPAGTQCTGGASKNLCLASFTTTAGFGNCVVVSQAVYTADTAVLHLMTDQTTGVRSGVGVGVKRSLFKRDKKRKDMEKSSKAHDNTADKHNEEARKHHRGHKAHKPNQAQKTTLKRFWSSRWIH